MQLPSTTQPAADPHYFPSTARRGFTMIELMVAAGITMILFAALLQAFKTIGDTVTRARATMEMSGQLRTVTHRLREDLRGVTVPMRPWTRPNAGEGYFEYVEGALSDNRTAGSADAVAGDLDDVIMFTARSDGEPFVGRFNGNIIESRVAEIIWWVRFTPLVDDLDADGAWDPGEQLTLHRRVLLIRPDLGTIPFPADPGVPANLDPADSYTGLNVLSRRLKEFYDNNDVSVRILGTNLVGNSLGDVTNRENRFAHTRVFPYAVDNSLLHNFVQTFPEPLGAFVVNVPNGHDVIASNLVAFDVRVYDPMAPIFPDSTGVYALVPGDNEYDTQRTAPVPAIGRGAFVDLNYANSATLSQFSGTPDTKSKLTTPTYCTWSFHYEQNGANEDLDALTDEGTNGLDDDGFNGVDDIVERETSPPYPRPLRGVQVRIRMLEPDSEEVQQFSVVKDFTPE